VVELHISSSPFLQGLGELPLPPFALKQLLKKLELFQVVIKKNVTISCDSSIEQKTIKKTLLVK
jgi:hypothetical protein